MLIPRDYQASGRAALWTFFEEQDGHPIVAMPTGTGKSLVIADFIKSAFDKNPAYARSLMITHVMELIDQNFDKLMQYWPTAPAGIYSAGLDRKDVGYPITYAGIASLNQSDLSLFGKIDLIFIDECHLISPDEATMYRKVIAFFMALNPFLKVIGLTATYWRQGQGLLTEGDNALFTHIAFNACVPEAYNWFFDQGYLIKPVPKKTKTEFDINKLRTRAGDYREDDMQKLFGDDAQTIAALEEIIQEGENRDCWLIFASGVDHVEQVSRLLNSYGIPTTFVHSKMKGKSKSKEREQRIKDFKAGKYRCMVNNGVLTTGFDHPPIDLIAVLRSTKVSSLWVQMVGRGTRPDYAPGFDLSTQAGRLSAILASNKHDCLVLDFGQNRRRLGPINDPVIPQAKGKKQPGDPPTKICPVCASYVFAGAKFCEFCGHEFPRHLNIVEGAETTELVKPKDPDEQMPLNVPIFTVDRITYDRKFQTGKPPSIKVSYYCGMRKFQEFVCLEHPGYAGTKARNWWAERSNACTPATTSDAMALLDTLKKPVQIMVWIKKSENKIVGYDFTGHEFYKPDEDLKDASA